MLSIILIIVLTIVIHKVSIEYHADKYSKYFNVAGNIVISISIILLLNAIILSFVTPASWTLTATKLIVKNEDNTYVTYEDKVSDYMVNEIRGTLNESTRIAYKYHDTTVRRTDVELPCVKTYKVDRTSLDYMLFILPKPDKYEIVIPK